MSLCLDGCTNEGLSSTTSPWSLSPENSADPWCYSRELYNLAPRTKSYSKYRMHSQELYNLPPQIKSYSIGCLQQCLVTVTPPGVYVGLSPLQDHCKSNLLLSAAHRLNKRYRRVDHVIVLLRETRASCKQAQKNRRGNGEKNGEDDPLHGFRGPRT